MKACVRKRKLWRLETLSLKPGGSIEDGLDGRL